MTNDLPIIEEWLSKLPRMDVASLRDLCARIRADEREACGVARLRKQLIEIADMGRADSKIVEKLPHTADGVPIVPGMKLYDAYGCPGECEVEEVWLGDYGGRVYVKRWGKIDHEKSYSTLEAAQAAIRARG